MLRQPIDEGCAAAWAIWHMHCEFGTPGCVNPMFSAGYRWGATANSTANGAWDRYSKINDIRGGIPAAFLAGWIYGEGRS